jgi:hypothetical protein
VLFPHPSVPGGDTRVESPGLEAAGAVPQIIRSAIGRKATVTCSEMSPKLSSTASKFGGAIEGV